MGPEQKCLALLVHEVRRPVSITHAGNRSRLGEHRRRQPTRK